MSDPDADGAGATRSMAPAPVVTVAACQLAPVGGQVAAHLRNVKTAVLADLGGGAQVGPGSERSTARPT